MAVTVSIRKDRQRERKYIAALRLSPGADSYFRSIELLFAYFVCSVGWFFLSSHAVLSHRTH